MDPPNFADLRTQAGNDAGTPHSKLSAKFHGPYKVFEAFEHVFYLAMDNEHKSVNANLLTTCLKERPIPDNPNETHQDAELDRAVPVARRERPMDTTEDLEAEPEPIAEDVNCCTCLKYRRKSASWHTGTTAACA